MSSGTAYYNLRKDASTDNYNVSVVNQNLDDIDAQMHQNEVAATTPFTGATSSANGEKGIVPRPLVGDQEKYLKGDGTWDTPQGGGGGSTVIPNPTGTPTDTLDTVSIDGTIYEIQGSGGGSGSSFEEEQLYKASSMSFSDITVDWDWNNYDLYILYSNDTLTQSGESTVLTKEKITDLINNQEQITIYTYGDNGVCLYTPTANQLTANSHTNNFVIIEIIGIKIKGSSGGGGGGSHTYSTTEQIVGTWIDGSDLYEKTINLTGTYQGDSTIDISSYLIGNENIIESAGYLSYVYSGSTYIQPINGYYVNLEYRVNKYQLKLSFGSGSSFSMDAYITIRYTKTGGNS